METKTKTSDDAKTKTPQIDMTQEMCRIRQVNDAKKAIRMMA